MHYTNPLGAELRSVTDARRDGQPVRAVEGSRLYLTDRADLWDALTNPERIPRWFLPIEGELELGGSYQLEGNAGGKILRCDAPEVLEVTWEYGGNVSWVTVRLVPEGEGTRLTLVHSMPRDEASEKHWTTYGPGATGVGWDLALLGLGMHLASGEAVDSDESMSWMGSDDGKAFLRASAEAWGRAHTESGTEAGVAGQMAARTAAFYTGE